MQLLETGGLFAFCSPEPQTLQPMNAKRSTGGGTHRFGGDWTTTKLDVIAR